VNEAWEKALHQLHGIIDGCRPKGKDEEHQGLIESGTDGDTSVTEQQLAGLKTKLRYLVFDLEATRRENRYFRGVMRARRRTRRLRREEENGKG
jgi:hypothetical protein